MAVKKQLNIVDIENGLEILASKELSPEEYGKEIVLLFSSPNTLKRITTSKSNVPEVDGGLLWREKLHYAPCKPGELDSTLQKLRFSQKSIKHKVRLLMVNDGVNTLVFDRKYDELTQCSIQSIKDEPQLFLPLTGQEGFRKEEESEVDIKATGKLAKLYDALVAENPDWLEGEKRHDLNHFMTQVIFCLFAEDTGIFPEDILSKTLINRAGSHGDKSTQLLTDIFNTLDTPLESRADLPAWLTEFPYVNGGLFKGLAKVPQFTDKAFRYLMEAAKLDWKHINPDILGSSIQAIVDPTMRGNLGMHYTSVPNILKTLDPLFLDDLRDEFFAARHSKKKLNEFLKRLSNIIVFDPACGSGNFLVIAYRELRKLELQALDALRDIEQGASMAFGFASIISLNNFYGIELADFAAETAKLALWIAEYQQNARFSAAFGAEIPSLPLKSSCKVLCENALRVSWSEFCPLQSKSEIYLVGNPPYYGATGMDKSKKADMELVFSKYTKNYKILDYVCAWFLKAAEFIDGTDNSYSFVATNSINQGSQVAILWPILFKKNMEIFFARQSFKWSNNASNQAAVICVVIGVRGKRDEEVKIYSENRIKVSSNINGYLLNAPNVEVLPSKVPLNGLPLMQKGNQPTDGGNLILSHEERANVLRKYPELDKYMKRLLGSKEIINGGDRFCFWIDNRDLNFAENHPLLSARLKAVEQMRLASPDKGTQKLAKRSHQFREFRLSDCTLAVPSVSSENRNILPASIYNSSTILTNLALAVYNAELWHFSIVVSRMHFLWITTVCGRLKSDFRYSSTLGWHTFPLPFLTGENKRQLGSLGREILVTREKYFPKSIADLYDPKNMPDDLRKEHEDNDTLFESFYRDEPFKDDNDRLTHLFERYVEMVENKD